MVDEILDFLRTILTAGFSVKRIKEPLETNFYHLIIELARS